MRIHTLLLCCLVLAGCFEDERRTQTGLWQSIYEMPASTVVLTVNGASITKQDFTDLQDFYKRCYNLRRGKPVDADDALAKSFSTNREQLSLEELMRRAIIATEAERTGINLPDGDVQAGVSNFLQKIGFKGEKYKAYSDAFGEPQMRLMCEIVRNDLLTQKLLEKACSNELVVTAADIERGRSIHNNLVAEIASSNNWRNARFEKALAQLDQGEEFAEIGREFSMIRPNESVYWGEFDLSDFPGNDSFVKWLACAHSNEYSHCLFDFNDGASIVKVLGTSQDAEIKDRIKYQLARITFLVWEVPPDLTDADIRRDWVQYKRNLAFQKVMKKLFSEAKITYPNGHRFFDKKHGGKNEQSH